MAGRPFLFGKLPAHGDFVARGLSHPARERWDAAGAALLGALRDQAPDFEAAHGVAPPWRFVTAGEGGWRAGAIAPSIDAVGRRFLLAIGLEGLDAAVAGGAGLILAAEADAAIYEAISGGLDADAALSAAAERLAAAEQAAGEAARRLAAPAQAPGVWWTLGSESFAPAAVEGREPPADLFARTVARQPETVG